MKIVIVGLGVIGGSFGMALKEAGYEEVFGLDRSQETLNKALAMGIIRKGSCRGEELLPQADLTILAIYPQDVKRFILENRDLFKPGSLITDVTGVKTPLVEALDHLLPADVDFVPGHPMAGREKKGIDFASAQVFKGANYLVTPIPGNKEENIRKITDLALSLGFKRVRRITPADHDEMIAFTSQLPHALAVALINSDQPDRETGQFIGDSYRDLTRIANINGELWSELFLENRQALLTAIENFDLELEKIRQALLREDKETLMACFKESSRRREALDVQ